MWRGSEHNLSDWMFFGQNFCCNKSDLTLLLTPNNIVQNSLRRVSFWILTFQESDLDRRIISLSKATKMIPKCRFSHNPHCKDHTKLTAANLWLVKDGTSSGNAWICLRQKTRNLCTHQKLKPPSKIQAGDGHPLQFHKCYQQRIHLQRVTPVQGCLHRRCYAWLHCPGNEDRIIVVCTAIIIYLVTRTNTCPHCRL